MDLWTAATAELTRWRPPDDEQTALRDGYLAHLLAHPDGATRVCNPDHLTASMIVLDQSRRRVLLNLHRRYRIWIQFGGHCEPADASLAAAALREASEESGVVGLEPIGDGPIQLNTHEVRCGPITPAHHLDVRFAALAPQGAEPQVSDESLDVRWFALDDLPNLEDEVRQLIECARLA